MPFIQALQRKRKVSADCIQKRNFLLLLKKIGSKGKRRHGLLSTQKIDELGQQKRNKILQKIAKSFFFFFLTAFIPFRSSSSKQDIIKTVALQQEKEILIE